VIVVGVILSFVICVYIVCCCLLLVVLRCSLLMLCCVVFMLIDNDEREARIWGIVDTTTATKSYNRHSKKSPSADYGFCTHFRVYARNVEVRQDKKGYVTLEHVKNESFHFQFVFFRSRDVNIEHTT
jgi:hypothetical protein